MSVDPRQLECFIAVAEELSLHRAAARLHMTQPPLSRRIKKLERDIGATLFRRTPGGMELTEPGTILLERAYRIVKLTDHAVERTRLANAGGLGQLAVGYYDSAILDGIPSIISDFLERHPKVDVSFHLVPALTQIDYVRDRILHIGFGRHYSDEKGITQRSVLLEPLYVALKLPPGEDPRGPMTIADLRGQPLVLYPTTRPGFADEVVAMCLDAGFPPMAAVHADDEIACLAYVAVGSAMAVVPESATKTLYRGVTYVPLVDAAPADLNCVYLSKPSTAVMQRFAAFLDERDASSASP
jgi:DNA-binding transcriptional LysR family regulator